MSNNSSAENESPLSLSSLNVASSANQKKRIALRDSSGDEELLNRTFHKLQNPELTTTRKLQNPELTLLFAQLEILFNNLREKGYCIDSDGILVPFDKDQYTFEKLCAALKLDSEEDQLFDQYSDHMVFEHTDLRPLSLDEIERDLFHKNADDRNVALDAFSALALIPRMRTEILKRLSDESKKLFDGIIKNIFSNQAISILLNLASLFNEVQARTILKEIINNLPTIAKNVFVSIAILLIARFPTLVSEISSVKDPVFAFVAKAMQFFVPQLPAENNTEINKEINTMITELNKAFSNYVLNPNEDFKKPVILAFDELIIKNKIEVTPRLWSYRRSTEIEKKLQTYFTSPESIVAREILCKAMSKRFISAKEDIFSECLKKYTKKLTNKGTNANNDTYVGYIRR